MLSYQYCLLKMDPRVKSWSNSKVYKIYLFTMTKVIYFKTRINHELHYLNIKDWFKALPIFLRTLINKKTKHKIFRVLIIIPNFKTKNKIIKLILKIVIEINRLSKSKKIIFFILQSKNKDFNQILVFKIENIIWKKNKKQTVSFLRIKKWK